MTAIIEISNLQMDGSPRNRDLLRVSTKVDFGGWLWPTERAWFEIPKALVSEASERGDCWLLAILPAAVSLGRPLRLQNLPVDPVLLANTERLMAIWSEWYPWLSPVAIEAESCSLEAAPTGRKTGAFFSGGVDSFYTLLHSAETGSETIDDLLLIHGFDIPIDNEVAFQRVFQLAQRVAAQADLALTPIATNLRETQFEVAGWSDLAFGCLLAANALQLSNRYSDVLISSGIPLDQIRAHASHPETDPLLSNSFTSFRQYGLDKKRHEKIGYLCSHPLALDNLRVCYESDRGDNCCRCLKCVLAMTILEVFGELENSEAFTRAPLDFRRLRRTYLSRGINPYRDTQQLAWERGRKDVAQAIEVAFERTARARRMMLGGLIPAVHRLLKRRPIARRLLRPLYHPLRRAAIWFNRHLP